MFQEWFSHIMGIKEAVAVMCIFILGGLTFLTFNFCVSRMIIRHLVGCEDCHSDDINRKTRAYNKIASISALIVMIMLAVYLPYVPRLVARVIGQRRMMDILPPYEGRTKSQSTDGL